MPPPADKKVHVSDSLYMVYYTLYLNVVYGGVYIYIYVTDQTSGASLDFVSVPCDASDSRAHGSVD